MFNFVTNIFKPVVNWVTDSAGEAVAAVAASAIKGAVYGAVIGAAQAAISGGDIKKGALRGAAAGGVFAGVTSSLMQMSGMEGYSGAEQLEKMGFSDSKTPEQNLLTDLGDAKPKDPAMPISEKYAPPDPEPPMEAKEPWWKVGDDEKGKLYAGILGGAATGAGNYLAAKEKAESDKDLLEHRAQRDKQRIADNKASRGFEQKTANIKMRTWWEDRVK